MNKLIEELTKVNPANLSEEGLKLFNKINEIIDRNKDLEEANSKLAFEFGKREMEIKQLNKVIDTMALMIVNYDDQLVINHYKNKEEVKERVFEYIKKEDK